MIFTPNQSHPRAVSKSMTGDKDLTGYALRQVWNRMMARGAVNTYILYVPLNKAEEGVCQSRFPRT